MTENGDPTVESLRDRAPGESREDPYEDIDLDDLPDWWRSAVEEFEAHDLRPFRPSRFDDGTIAYPLIVQLENELDVQIRIVGKNVREGNSWQIVVDGRAVGPVMKKRTVAGYTVYELGAEEFEQTVRSAASSA